MLNEPNPNGDPRQSLSSLMDSELEQAALTQVIAAWQADADSRATWHCYHLIGDVMRSDELARPARRDAAMLQALRLRLADEPVPLAPTALDEVVAAGLRPSSADDSAQPGVAPARRFGRLRMPAAAAAAGFVVVAGVMVLLRQAGPSAADGAQLARAQPQSQALVATPAGTLVRDAGLDRYLEAHRRLGSSVAAAGAAEHRVQIVHESK